jgi:hypothetical protein
MAQFGIRSLCVPVICLFAFLGFIFHTHSPAGLKEPVLNTKLATAYQSSHAVVEQWKIATSARIVALIFYGRREFVSILDCYLQVNLATPHHSIDTHQMLAKPRSKWWPARRGPVCCPDGRAERLGLLG